MLKAMQGFRLIVLCVWVVYANTQIPEVQISLTTLKSDLILILQDPNPPRTVNIEYAPNCVLRLLVVPTHYGTHEKTIKIDQTVTIKKKSTPVIERNDFAYKDGWFGVPSTQEDTTYIVLKADTTRVLGSADKTLQYVPLTNLKNRIDTEIKFFGLTKENTNFYLPALEVGLSHAALSYSSEDDQVLFHQPLKGIALYRGDKIGSLIKPQTYKNIKNRFRSTNPMGDLLGGLSNFVATKEPKSLLSGFSKLVGTKHPDVLFDVWYDPKSGQIGSSSGSLDGVDAVRVYDEWVQDTSFTAVNTVDMSIWRGRGESIRQKTFADDMYSAFTELFNPRTTYDNAIFNYADEVVIEVNRGEGENYVSAKGTTQADAFGHGPYDFGAYYDLNKLDDSRGGLEGQRFVPIIYDQRTWYLKHTDWDLFERHLWGIWKAMQGGCKHSRKSHYDFRIHYGESILVRYDCKRSTIDLQGTILMFLMFSLFDHAGSFVKCNTLRYLPSLRIESPCFDTSHSPLSIRQQPQELWVTYAEPISISAVVVRHDLAKLRDDLVRNGKSKVKALKRGAILLDEYMLLVMTIPENADSPVYVYPHGSSHKQLTFHRGHFSTDNGFDGLLKDVSTIIKFQQIGPNVVEKFVIGAKYVTIEKLRQDLKRLSEEAWRRCTAREVKNLLFMLVYHRGFAFQGYYDCSAQVSLVEGNFQTLIKNRNNESTEIFKEKLMLQQFIYVHNDEFFITDGQAMDAVHAISVPQVNVDAGRKYYGAPIILSEHSFILFKSPQAG